MPLFNTFVLGEPLNPEIQRQETRNIAVICLCEIYVDILNRLGVDHDCVTDRQTDGRTDRMVFSNGALKVGYDSSTSKKLVAAHSLCGAMGRRTAVGRDPGPRRTALGRRVSRWVSGAVVVLF